MLRVRAFWLRLPCRSTDGMPRLVELAGQRLGAVLGAGEDDRAAGGAGQVDEHRHALVAGDVQHVVRHRRDRRLGRVGLVGDRVGQEALDQHVDRLVERRGEQQALSGARRLVHDPAHAGQEAEVGHVVGLVEDGDLDRGQVRVALAHEVLEAAGAGDDDVDALLERGGLRALAHAAVDHDGGQAGGVGHRLERRRGSGRPARGWGPGSAHAACAASPASWRRRGARSAAARTRTSCRSRCGHGRARRDRRGCRAASRPGWEWGW